MKFEQYLESINLDKIPENYRDSFLEYINEAYLNSLLEGDTYKRLRSIMPQLSEDDTSYLKRLISESFQDTILRIKDATQMDWNALLESLPYMLGFGGASLMSDILSIESGHEKELMKLAIGVLPNIPIFKPHMDMIEQFEFNLNLNEVSESLSTDDLKFDFDFPEIESDVDEDDFSSLMNELKQDNKEAEKTKREFSNLLMHGISQYSTRFYELFLDDISKIVNHPKESLAKKYKMLTAIGDLGYWMLPPNMEEMAGLLSGKANFSADENGVEIQASALSFPYLLHELVKGLVKYVQQVQDGANEIGEEIDTVSHERVPLTIGRQYVLNILEKIDSKYLLDVLTKSLAETDFINKEEAEEYFKNLLTSNNAGDILRKKLMADIDEYL